MVYIGNPAILQVAIDVATLIFIGYELTTGMSKIGNIEKDEIAELQKQITNLAIAEQIRFKQLKNNPN